MPIDLAPPQSSNASKRVNSPVMKRIGDLAFLPLPSQGLPRESRPWKPRQPLCEDANVGGRICPWYLPQELRCAQHWGWRHDFDVSDPRIALADAPPYSHATITLRFNAAFPGQRATRGVRDSLGFGGLRRSASIQLSCPQTGTEKRTLRSSATTTL